MIQLHHFKSLLPGRAYLDTAAAALTIQRADLQADFHPLQRFAVGFAGNKSIGSSGFFFLIHQNRTDSGVRADHRTAVALDAILRQPLRYEIRHATLLILRGTHRECAVCRLQKSTDRQLITLLGVDGIEDILGIGTAFGSSSNLGIGSLTPALRHFHQLQTLNTGQHGLFVHIDDILTLAAVGVLDAFIQRGHGSIDRNDISQLKERTLHNHIGTVAQAQLTGDAGCVDGVEFNIVFGNITLHSGRQLTLDVLGCPTAAQQEHTTGLQPLQQIVGIDIRSLRAGNKVRLTDEIGCLDLLTAKTQMRDGDTAGFFTVIREVCLSIHLGIVIDNADSLLIGADSTVRAKTPEFALDSALGQHIRHIRRSLNRGMINVIIDSHREITLRLIGRQIIEHADNIRRYGILGGQTIAAADHHNRTAGQSHRHILMQRGTDSTRHLDTVQHSHALYSLRQHRQHIFRRERTEQTHLQETDLTALCQQMIHRLISHLADRAHSHDDIGGIGRAVIIKRMILAACQLTDPAHIISHDSRQLLMIPVAGLLGLEENVGILRRALYSGVAGIQRTRTEGTQRLLIDHTSQIVIIPDLDLLLLMRGTEAVKEMQERQTALDSRQMCHGGQIHSLLHAGRTQHGKACLVTGHNVTVIAEDAESMTGDGARRNVHNAGQQLTRNSVHIGDHQQKTLRCSICRSKRTRSQSAVESTCSAALRLHFGNRDLLAKNIFTACCLPLIHILRHRRRRRDRINSGNISESVCDISRRLIAVHCCLKLLFCHYRNQTLSKISHKKIKDPVHGITPRTAKQPKALSPADPNNRPPAK